MSGIYGIVRLDGAPVTQEMLAPMGTAMPLWGPDGHGNWCGEGAGLGRLMLHVTPESLHERLPVSLATAPHLVITADARIDNRDELFAALGVPAPERAKIPDSSLILLAYERWGADCVKRLLGDFAFAIRDSRKRTLFCARDVFGCRPFLYHSDNRRFLFASDIKGVLASVESPKLNEPLIAAYLQFQTYHAEKRHTFFEGVVKLPPAHSLLVSESGLQLSRYWSPKDAPGIRLASDDEYAGQMRVLFEEAVRCRLRSAFPVGSHLSGGLDSSAISIQAARILRSQGKPLAVFSWSPPPDAGAMSDPGSEHLRIDAVCRQEGLVCQYIPPTKESFIETFRRDVSVEPAEMMAWESGVQTAAHAQGLRVMLSGWGGDEAVTSQVKSARSIRTLLPDSLFALLFDNDFPDHRAPCIQRIFADTYREQTASLRGPVWRRYPGIRNTNRYRLEYGHIPLRLEHWNVSGARKCLEYRYPMLDRRLVEFALGSPESGSRRAAFLLTTASLMPMVDWMTAKKSPETIRALRMHYLDALREKTDRLLQSARLSAHEFVDVEKIARLVGSFRQSDLRRDFSGIQEAFGVLRATVAP